MQLDVAVVHVDQGIQTEIRSFSRHVMGRPVGVKHK